MARRDRQVEIEEVRMRRFLIAANWKMYGSLAMAHEFAESFDQSVDLGADVVLFPPAVYLSAVQGWTSEFVQVGIQDIGAALQGAHTGEIAASMVKDLGGSWVIVGHSERRTDQGESNELVARKFASAVAAGLRPIVCVGESLEQRNAGDAFAVVSNQLKAVIDLCGVTGLQQGAIAYEPLWAIGTGLTATPDQAGQMHAAIRNLLVGFDQDVAQLVRIIYGGSVNPENAGLLFAQEDIDGALVGGASLKASSFAAVVAAI
ncbi:MAG: triosephosphate isomerase [Candidatus Azotimanducaceae bacterium]|jgi:triosephosphate isomerase|tara:strand:- start:128 stop:910 length:783 start_codon:yes stop_codon:yes gene_type:complete